ncbi:hypothetical protein J6590_079334 [Homalodisca vitripennis]|nr:hypothetical protein J6590_079334 [Homalodisca vitripennis]
MAGVWFWHWLTGPKVGVQKKKEECLPTQFLCSNSTLCIDRTCRNVISYYRIQITVCGVYYTDKKKEECLPTQFLCSNSTLCIDRTCRNVIKKKKEECLPTQFLCSNSTLCIDRTCRNVISYYRIQITVCVVYYTDKKKEECLPTQFLCSNSTLCIDRTCRNVIKKKKEECLPTQFLCSNSTLCIDRTCRNVISYYRIQITVCVVYYTEKKKEECLPTQFLCSNSTLCIDRTCRNAISYYRIQITVCSVYYTEKKKEECLPTQFLCSNSTLCIDRTCRNVISYYRIQITVWGVYYTEKKKEECLPTQFLCSNSTLCIDRTCRNVISYYRIQITVCGVYYTEKKKEECLPTQFLCSNSTLCIDHHQVCDMSLDCPDGYDEHQNCDKVNVEGSRCNFESGMCGWNNDNENRMNWTLHSGPTETDHTGPSVDHTYKNITGKYIYVEMSGSARLGAASILASPLFNPPPPVVSNISSRHYNACYIELVTGQLLRRRLRHTVRSRRHMQVLAVCHVTFYYHQYGPHSGSLTLMLKEQYHAQIKELWRSFGDQGNVWKRVIRPLPPVSQRVVSMTRAMSGPPPPVSQRLWFAYHQIQQKYHSSGGVVQVEYNLYFEAKKSYSMRGDVALDDYAMSPQCFGIGDFTKEELNNYDYANAGSNYVVVPLLIPSNVCSIDTQIEDLCLLYAPITVLNANDCCSDKREVSYVLEALNELELLSSMNQILSCNNVVELASFYPFPHH